MTILKKTVLTLILLIGPSISLAATTTPVKLEHVNINIKDKAALLRGAKFYAQNCMVCHTMTYLQHNELAKEAGITLDKMPLKQKTWYLNIAPPDLSLEARMRTPNWIYTYLVSFYKDESRPTGSNNLVVKNTVMANLFLVTQGEQVLTQKGMDVLKNPDTYSKMPYYSLLELKQAGSMTPEQFHQTISDLVNFFVYASDPSKLERQHIGYWVLGFLLLFFVIAFLLKKAYWQDVTSEPKR